MKRPEPVVDHRNVEIARAYAREATGEADGEAPGSAKRVRAALAALTVWLEISLGSDDPDDHARAIVATHMLAQAVRQRAARRAITSPMYVQAARMVDRLW